jgi:hypothetical protein
VCDDQQAAEVVGESKPNKFVVVCEGQGSRNTANCVLDDVHRHYLGVLGFLNRVLQYTCSCNFISTCNIRMAFTMLAFTKFINAEQHYVQMSYKKNCPNWTVCVESKAIPLQACRAQRG